MSLQLAHQTQCEQYRSPHHLTRNELTTNPQMYETTDEIRQWSMPKAAQFLATYTLKRNVVKNDYIQLINNCYTIGHK